MARGSQTQFMRDLYWTAGFIEGEGCFAGWTGIRVSQVQREPLDRLVHLWGGTITLVPPQRNGLSAKAIHRWQLYGANARGLMMTLYTLMSPRRQEQISKVLNKWRTNYYNYTPETRATALQRIEAGERPIDVARDMNLNQGIVYYWKKVAA
jgi:hypothetical protein